MLGPWARTELFANFGLGSIPTTPAVVTTTVDLGTGAAVSRVTPLAGTRGAEAGLRTEIVPAVQTSVSLWRLDLGSELVFTETRARRSPRGLPAARGST